MKPKYTTEALREKLFWELNNLICNVTDEIKEEALKIEGAGSITDGGTGNTNYTLQLSHHIDQLVPVFTAQQQALIEEIEQRLPTLKDLPEYDRDKTNQMGYREGVIAVIETLKAIRKELV